VRRRARERLEQPVGARVRQSSNRVTHRAIVDRRADRVLGRLRDLERYVEQKGLAVPPLGFAPAVAADDLQPVDLDDHAMALATVSASTCSFTSCTRRMVAPRSYAATAAAIEAERGPLRATGSPSTRPSELFREKPTSTGRPSLRSTSRRETSSKFCSTVLPKPIPGSRQIPPLSTPAATAKPSPTSRNAATSGATSGS